jgi:hypothetical protein
VTRRTVLSACRTYRYVLWRELDVQRPGYALFIGLNPSTADEVADDPTIRRCQDFARRWGYGAVCVVNLFAYRATKPAELKAAAAPVGRGNDRWLTRVAAGAGVVVAAWGVHGTFAGRDRAVTALLGGRLTCLGVTKDGHPRHPLYLKRTAVPRAWVPAAVCRTGFQPVRTGWKPVPQDPGPAGPPAGQSPAAPLGRVDLSRVRLRDGPPRPAGRGVTGVWP